MKWHDPLRTHVVHKAEIRDLHSSLSVAIFSTSFHVFPVVFISAWIVLIHISRGWPRFLLPLSGIHLSAVLVMLSRSFRITCPSHLHLSCYITAVMSSWPVFWQRSSFEIFWDQYILYVFCRHEVWKPGSLWLSLWVTLQHSVPERSTDKTLLLQIFILGFSLMLHDLHALFSRTKDDLAFWGLLVMSFSMALVLLPK